MDKVEVYKLREKHGIKTFGGKRVSYFPHMIFHFNDEKSDGKYSFVEWVNEDDIVEQSDYFDKMRLRILKNDIQGKYRLILDKSYVNNLLSNIIANTAREALLYNSQGYEWSSK